jgi:hypothetical protein
MTLPVELYSMTDPVYVTVQSVWYWVEFEGLRSEKTEDYKLALSWAQALCVEHDTCLIDRSDKGSGYLLSTLGR